MEYTLHNLIEANPASPNYGKPVTVEMDEAMIPTLKNAQDAGKRLADGIKAVMRAIEAGRVLEPPLPQGEPSESTIKILSDIRDEGHRD